MSKEIVDNLGERTLLIVEGTNREVFLEGFFQQSLRDGKTFDFVQPLYAGAIEEEVSPLIPERTSSVNPVLKRHLSICQKEVRYAGQTGRGLAVAIYRIPKKGVPCQRVDYVADSEIIFSLYTPAMQKSGFDFKADEVK